jgi:hypothetical protein
MASTLTPHESALAAPTTRKHTLLAKMARNTREQQMRYISKLPGALEEISRVLEVEVAKVCGVVANGADCFDTRVDCTGTQVVAKRMAFDGADGIWGFSQFTLYPRLGWGEGPCEQRILSLLDCHGRAYVETRTYTRTASGSDGDTQYGPFTATVREISFLRSGFTLLCIYGGQTVYAASEDGSKKNWFLPVDYPDNTVVCSLSRRQPLATAKGCRRSLFDAKPGLNCSLKVCKTHTAANHPI